MPETSGRKVSLIEWGAIVFTVIAAIAAIAYVAARDWPNETKAYSIAFIAVVGAVVVTVLYFHNMWVELLGLAAVAFIFFRLGQGLPHYEDQQRWAEIFAHHLTYEKEPAPPEVRTDGRHGILVPAGTADDWFVLQRVRQTEVKEGIPILAPKFAEETRIWSKTKRGYARALTLPR